MTNLTTEPTTWQIDAAHSSVDLSVKHMMFTTVRGRFNDVKGTITIDGQDPKTARVAVEIAAASIDTGVADRDAHLRSADFLDVEQFPTITFVSKRVEGATLAPGSALKIVGDLTIRGKAVEVALDAIYHGAGNDPWGQFKAGAEASGKIDRRDWGLVWNQTLETGGILVGTDIRIDAQVQAVKAVAKAA